MWYNFFWNLLKQGILSVYHDFHGLLVATKLLTAKRQSCYDKVSESDILERSGILPPTPQPWQNISFAYLLSPFFSFILIDFRWIQVRRLNTDIQVSTLHKRVGKELISKNFLIGNRFHVTLRILNPKSCKQCLRLKSWKAKIRAEKANKLKTKMKKSEHKLQQ